MSSRYRCTLLGSVSCSAALLCGLTTSTAFGHTSSHAKVWQTYNHTLTGQRYSSLAQINTGNVGRLRVLCTYDTRVQTSFEAGIIKVGGTLYGTTEMDTFAIDPSTCAEKWRVHETYTSASSLHVNRGAAYLDGRLFRGTEDGRVLAYDAQTGRRLWQAQIGNPAHGETVPAAPIAWNGMVFAGNAGGDNKGVKGRVYALDAASGRILWTFYMVPREQENGSRLEWYNAPEIPITGGATWTTYTLDPSTGLLYVPGGNAAPDFDKSLREGDNLYTGSVVVLRADSGSYQTHYPVAPADFHDWDESTAPALLTTQSGKHIIAVAAKDGYLHGFDQTTHRELYKTPVTLIENATTPLTVGTPVHFCPGTQGGSEWNGPAYDPHNNLIITGAVQWCSTVTLAPSSQTSSAPYYQPWTANADPKHPFGTLDPVSVFAGWVYAVNADTGTVVWKYRAPYPVVGGVTPTAGGLVFAGDLGGKQYAFDAVSGQILWSINLGGAIGGGVITYTDGGAQRVAVAYGMTSSIWPTVQATAKIAVLGLPDNQ